MAGEAAGAEQGIRVLRIIRALAIAISALRPSRGGALCAWKPRRAGGLSGDLQLFLAVFDNCYPKSLVNSCFAQLVRMNDPFSSLVMATSLECSPEWSVGDMV